MPDKENSMGSGTILRKKKQCASKSNVERVESSKAFDTRYKGTIHDLPFALSGLVFFDSVFFFTMPTILPFWRGNIYSLL